MVSATVTSYRENMTKVIKSHYSDAKDIFRDNKVYKNSKTI